MRIVVLGAGIVGASAAYHLTRLGAEVYLIDRDAPGRATFAGAGIICPWLSQVRDLRYERLSFAAARYYPELVIELAAAGETETEYEVVGGLVVGESAGQLEAIVKRLQAHLDRGATEIGEVRPLSSGGPKERFRYLDPALAGVYLSGAARVSGEMFRAALCKAAIRADARRLLGTAALENSGPTVVGVRVNGEYIPSDTVIVAAGAWSSELCRPLGIHLAVEPQRGQIVHLRVPETDTGTLPIILPALSDYYLLGFPDSRIVIGATRETGSGFDFRVTAGGVTEVLQEGFRIAPELQQATLTEIRVGFRPVSKDGLPLLGRIPSVSGLVIATGLGPYGLTVGPYVGLLAAQLAVGKSPAQDISAFEPERFI
ncbi:MAG: FAD-binding oxidoreductase [Chthoniobacterales bacterium]|jgi:D-amino-acid dehydrogenase